MLAPGAVILDVGSGTGISTLALSRALPEGSVFLGVEPNVDMRAEAGANVPAGRNITFVAGAADNLLVAAGTAIHWFDRGKFYAEARRAPPRRRYRDLREQPKLARFAAARGA